MASPVCQYSSGIKGKEWYSSWAVRELREIRRAKAAAIHCTGEKLVILVSGTGGGKGGGKGGASAGAALLGTAARAGGQGSESDHSAEEMLPAGEVWEGDTVGGTAGGGHARKGAGRAGAAWGGGMNKASVGTIVGGKGKRG